MTQQPHNAIGPDAPDTKPAWLGLPDSLVPQFRPESRTCPANAGRVVSWLGWHVLELAGVGGPLVLAVTVNAWFVALSAVTAAGWATHELRVARRNRDIRPGQPLLTSRNTTPDREGPDHDR